MKISLLFLLVLISQIIYPQGFPINFDSDSLRDAEKNLEKWNGKLIAIRGIVKEIKKAHQDKPYFLIELANENSEEKEIWVGSLVNAENKEKQQSLKVGLVIRVLGFFTTELDDLAKGLCNCNYHLIGMCILFEDEKAGFYAPPAWEQCEEWQNGIIVEPPLE